MIKNAIPTTGNLCYISKAVDDEKLATILQILEYVHFGDDQLSFWFGQEGVDWKRDENGNFQEINVLGNGENGARVFIQNVHAGELFETASLQETFKAGSHFWLGDDCVWRQTDREIYQYKLDLYEETDYIAMSQAYASQCMAVKNQYVKQWVVDGESVTDTWAQYLTDLEEAGYHLMMDELNKVEPLADMIARVKPS